MWEWVEIDFQLGCIKGLQISPRTYKIKGTRKIFGLSKERN